MAFSNTATEQHYTKTGLKALCTMIDANFALLEAGGAGTVIVDALTSNGIIQINDNVALNFEGIAADVDGLQITCDNAGDALINTTAGKLTLTTSDGLIATASGLELSGSNTDGINFSGTYTGNVLDFSSATIDPTGSGGPCMIRVGAYGSEVDYGADNHQSGVIRLYTTCSGDISSYDRGLFACTVTTGAKGAYPVAGLAEANNTGTGPKYLGAGQFIAHLGARSSGAVLTTLGGSANLLVGMYGAWLKVAAAGTATCNSGSRIAPLWLDNQMSGTVTGDEYGMYCTTGASRPDGWAGFSTGSSGYSQLLYFDTTFNSGAGTCVTTDAVPGGNQDARMMVYYNGTQYYVALYR